MNYVYDVYLNFNNIPYDFFEWNSKDTLTHLKKVPINKIDLDTFKIFCSNKIKIDSKFLRSIENKTEVWKNKNNIKYCSLFFTNSCILAIYFNNNGVSEKKSFLYVDEELEILETFHNIREKNIEYQILKKDFISLKTRNEIYKERFIKENLRNIDNDKLNYIYFECFGKNNTRKNMLYELTNIKPNSKKYKNLYNILKLISPK